MTAATSDYLLLHGRDEPLPEPTLLRAGPWTMVYEAGDLRYLRLGDRMVLLRIYAAVRDRDWGTVAGRLSNVQMDVREDSFRICYESRHRRDSIDFLWRGEIAGTADGAIRFAFDGEAKSSFLKNRIGFCVLHPMDCAGAPCQAEYVNGGRARLTFPKQVAAEQPVRGLHGLRALAHEVEPGLWAEVRFEGDTFEMEDQRNWTDASFKTFCTPLGIPYPVEMKAGQRVQQAVTLRWVEVRDGKAAAEKTVGTAVRRRPAGPALRISEDAAALPSIGLGMPGHNRAIRPSEIERLSQLRLTHLRADVSSADSQPRTALARSATEAAALGLGLELAVHLESGDGGRPPWRAYLESLRGELEKATCRPVRIAVFGGRQDKTSPLDFLRLAREILGPMGAPIGGGTNADFYQLNQARPPRELLDFVCFSMNPQVHAFDDASLIETLAAQAPAVHSARDYFGNLPVVVTPVTLRPRFNAVATGPEPPPAPGELPAQVDPRQMSLFAAVWTLGSIRYLTEAGAASVTYYETTGWQGVMETEAGPPLPDKFASQPEAVFPIYHVLADVGEFSGGELLPGQSTSPLRVNGFALRQAGRTRVLVANMSGRNESVSVTGLTGTALVKRLNVTNAEHAMRDPESWRAAPGQETALQAGLQLDLLPYEVTRVDMV